MLSGHFHLRLSSEVKSRIVGGEPQEVSKLLEAIRQRQPSGPGRQDRPGDQPRSPPASAMDALQQHARACFDLTMEQAGTLLAERGKMLAHLLIKGYKGSF